VSRTATTSLELHVVPRSSRNVLEKDAHDGLRLRIQAPPADGEANRAVVRFLAREILDLPQAAVRLVAGAASRKKRFEIDLDAETVHARIEAALQTPGKGCA
jgi:uncharacterized protein